jgi:hypothetical protein
MEREREREIQERTYESWEEIKEEDEETAVKKK